MPTAGLFGSGILDVALGLIFLYFLLSTIASSINEVIATALKWRAANLEFALGNLVTDPALLQQILDHPLIRSMGQNPSDYRGQTLTTSQKVVPATPTLLRRILDHLPTRSQQPSDDQGQTPTIAEKIVPKPRIEGRPSYLPSRTFAVAFMHSLSNPRPEVASLDWQGDGSIDVGRIRRTAFNLASVSVPEGNDAQARLAQAKQVTGQTINALLDECRDPTAAAKALDTAKQRLTDGLQHATDHDQIALRDQIETAVHLEDLRRLVRALPASDQDGPTKIINAAERDIDLSAYKVDNLRTSIESWFDHAMERAAGVYKRRAMLVLALIAVVMVALSGADSVTFVTRLYVDSAVRAQLAQQAGQTTQPTDITATVQSLEPFYTLFGYPDFPGFNASTFPSWLALKVAGLTITTFAIMLGGPFWFDLLGKVVNVRGSGPKPKSTTSAAGA